MSKRDANTLWVALSKYGEGNLFHVYPQLLSELLLQEEAARAAGGEDLERLVLPSDRDWRLQNYFMLVAMQKRDLDDGEEHNEANKSTDEVEVWAPWTLGLAARRNPNVPAPVAVRRVPGPSWDIAQVVKAARLLLKTPVKVEFVDEHEMRCVYSLIYDVFRYKSILEQAIDDVEFYEDYPLLLEYRHAVWLFLMELAKRGWDARPRGDQDSTAALLQAAGAPFPAVERAVWDQRVHFAAAIARIRIKNKAFTLSELLPPHLREEKISACVHKETVTGWVNTFKAKKVAALVKRLHELGYSYSNSRQLCAGEYRFDRVCPRFITLRPPPNVSIGQLDLVRDGIIVLQEREFCEGASTLCRALRAAALQGVVAQTHASSPRCSAYLAAQLRELAAVLRAQTPAAPAAPALGKLVVFGAGDQYVCRVARSSPRCSAYLAAQLRELAAVLRAQTPAAPAAPALGKLVVFGAGDQYVCRVARSSPRCSAYLAAQLRELAAVLRAQTPAAPAAPALGKLVVFGAGDQYVCRVARSSPRCSAYLAAQLRELAAVLRAQTPAAPAAPALGKLVVFGAGDQYVCRVARSSPRCSAYLAAQLRELAAVLRAQTPAAPAAPALDKLVVFGAGDQYVCRVARSSPRCSAYLAAQLRELAAVLRAQTPAAPAAPALLPSLWVESYVSALRALGIEASGAPQSEAAVRVLGEPVHGDTPRVLGALEGVVAALATPPNSYSSVTDPIDLVCGRGGDLAMLEILTQSEVDNEGKARVQSILEEQKKTLKTLLSKPQIQLILYETHSALEAENQTQITRAVAEANRLAREKHQVLKKKPKDQQSKSKYAVASDSATSIDNTISRSDIGKDEQLEDIFEDDPTDQSSIARSRPASSNILKKKANNESLDRGSRPGTTKARPIPEVVAPASDPVPRDPDKDSPDVHVPDCDLFEIRTLPHLGNGLDINYILDRDGCYLGLIQRKEITRLDAKYMIQVAEDRGLFGPAAPPPARRKRDAAAAPRRRKRNTSGFEVERLSAPTYSSMVRSTRRGSAPASLSVVVGAPEVRVCERHARRQAAASALAATACTCDARHRARAARRASLDGEPPRAGGAGACRRPFPLAVHDLRLCGLLPLQHRKVFA